MKTDITQKLTHESISALVEQFKEDASGVYPVTEQRKYRRKIVAGVVEFWPADGDWQQPLFGECCDISEGGLGMRSEYYLEPNALVGFAVHLDMASFHGLATVRYCQKVRDKFTAGLEFVFEV